MWEHRPPREVALEILGALFGDGPRSGEASGGAAGGAPGKAAGEPPAQRAHPLTAFQEAGLHRVRTVVGDRGGAILADAVGLGKTYIALALIEERLGAGHDVVVAVPAALRRGWRVPLRRLGAGGRGAGVRLVSHAQLSRGVAIRPASGPRLVVVDEAHRFRNPATRRYGALARLVADGPPTGGGGADRAAGGAAEPAPVGPAAELLLITATPMNNHTADLYHLLRLFLPDDGLRDAGVPSVRAAFEALHPALVGAVVRETVVRRTRRMVTERFGDASPPGLDVAFPRRAPPAMERYRDPGMADRVAALEALELAAYGAGAGPLLRMGLLKRLDSSPAALALSLTRLRGFLAAFVEAANAGRLLRPGHRHSTGDGDPLQLLLLGVMADDAPPELDLDALAASARRDIGVIDRALRRHEPPGAAAPDPKAQALAELLDRLGGEKVVVFTEYRDTAEALWRALAGRFRAGRVDGSGAWLGRRPAGRRAVVERFAPAANGRRPPPDRERVDVLIATDVLAEGLNLQDARHVVSYDLPWNPVRLLQRIGRIDRLGSPHAVVVPHLFVPADGLDAVLGLTRRLRAKLHGIATAVGEERAEELLEGLAVGRSKAVEVALRRADIADSAEPWERLRTLWLRAAPKGAHPTGARDAGPRPTRPPPTAWWGRVTPPDDSPAAELRAVVLAAHRGRPRLLEVTRDGAVLPADDAAAAAIEAALRADRCRPGADTAPGAPDAPDTPDARHAPDATDAPDATAPLLRRVRRHLAAEAATDRAPAPVRPGDVGARLARRIRRAMADAGSALDPGLVARAGTALRALDAPLHPAAESAAAATLDGMGRDADPGRLVEEVLAALGEPASWDPSSTDPPTISAVLNVG